jgi:hypothetical protein
MYVQKLVYENLANISQMEGQMLIELGPNALLNLWEQFCRYGMQQS